MNWYYQKNYHNNGKPFINKQIIPSSFDIAVPFRSNKKKLKIKEYFIKMIKYVLNVYGRFVINLF